MLSGEITLSSHFSYENLSFSSVSVIALKSRPPEGAEKSPRSGPFGTAALGPRRGLEGPQKAPGGTTRTQGLRRCLDGTESLLERFKSPARVPVAGHAWIAAAGCLEVSRPALRASATPYGLTGGQPPAPDSQARCVTGVIRQLLGASERPGCWLLQPGRGQGPDRRPQRSAARLSLASTERVRIWAKRTLDAWRGAHAPGTAGGVGRRP